MVKLVLVILFSVSPFLAYADRYVTGQDIKVGYVGKKMGGTYDFSFARGGLTIVDSKFRALTGHKAVMAQFRLDNSEVSDVDVSGATLAGSVWSGSVIGRGVFRSTDLSGATFYKIEINEGVFDRADLRGADLSEAILNNCTFTGALYNDQSRLPFGAAPAEELGMVYVP